MSNSIPKEYNNEIDFLNILVELRLTNITEIKILQESASFIDTHYPKHKSQIKLAKVAALILNRQDIPNLYATSSRGYNNQLLEYRNQFGISGYQIKEKLIPWAIDKILRAKLTEDLYQDIGNKQKYQIDTIEIEAQNFLEILANVNLVNVSEFQVMQEAYRYIHDTYPESATKINLSDVCALTLNHRSVFSLYATSAEEYEQMRQVYLSEYQFQVNEVIYEMVEKIYEEGFKLSLGYDSLIAVNFQRRKKMSKIAKVI